MHKLPVDLRKALKADKKALAVWEDVTPLARNEWICWAGIYAARAVRKERL